MVSARYWQIGQTPASAALIGFANAA